MNVSLEYCPNAAAVLERLRRFYDQRPPDLILAHMHVPSPATREYARGRAGGFCDCPDPSDRAAFWGAVFRERLAVCDDSVPSAYLSELDQGLYGGLLGGNVQFLFNADSGWVSSMVPPILGDLSEVTGLRFDRRHPWWERYLRHLGAYVAASHGRFGVSHLIAINGLNFVYELVGATQTYVELLDRPDLVRQALELSFEINQAIQETFFDHVPLVAGGTCSIQGQWLPGRIVCESVDPFHMTSPAYFEQWGSAVLERLFARFDGGVTHLHGNGRHLLEAMTTVRGLSQLSLGDDRGYPRALDVLPELRRRAGSLPLTVQASYPEFGAALAAHRLCGGVLYEVGGVPDIDAANRTMDQVRAYRAG